MKHSAARKLSAILISAAFLTQTILPVMQASAASESDLAAFRTRIREAWEAHETTEISTQRYNLTLDEASDAYYEMLYTDANWFDVASYFSYRGTSERITSLIIRYTYESESYRTRQQEFDAKVAEITGRIDPKWSDAEKVLYLHDYLAEHCAYDLTFSETSYNAYSALVTGKAVCQGYALAMCILCREVGIPCYAATYNAQDDDNHMWNVMEIDGSWYHTDVTFDDAAPDMLGHSSHDYLLQSDAVMLADGVHKTAAEWGGFTDGKTIVCDSERFADAFWVGALDTVHPMDDGTWLYAQKADISSVHSASDVKATLCRSDINGNTETLGTYPAYWKTPHGSVYLNCYISSQVYDGKIYFHTEDDICVVTLGDTTAETIYTLSAEQAAQGLIYGMTIDENGLLTYQVMPSVEFESGSYDLDVYLYTIQLEPETPHEPETTTVPETTTIPETTTVPETTTIPETTTVPETTTIPETTTLPETTTISETTVRSTTTTITTTQRPATTAPESTTVSAETTTAEITTVQTTTCTTTTTAAAPVPPEMQLRGDVTDNGIVDVSDAVLLARMLVEDRTAIITEQGRANADCDGSGKLDSEDVLWILRFLAHLIE